YITGAPRVFDGKVIIGHGGADNGPVRGYVTTYDADTGRQLWRFYVVPGNPPDGFESPALEVAANTWTGGWWGDAGGVAGRRGGHGLERDQLGRGAPPRLPWHRQRRAVEPEDPQPGRRRQPLPLLDRRARRRHRRVPLALPDHAGRDLGLQLGDGHRARDAQH